METKTRKVPKYQMIEKEVLRDIENNTFGVGEQISTEVALSAKHKVSRLTARKAIDNLHQRGYLVRTPGKGTFVADRKNGGAITRHKDIAALFVDMDTENLWNTKLLRGISREAEGQQYHVTFCDVSNEELHRGNIPLAISGHSVHGALVNGQVTDTQMRELLRYNIPYLFIGSYPSVHNQPVVDFDMEDMGYQITSHFLQLNRGPAWLVVEPFRLHYTQKIYQGYQRAIFEGANPQNMLNACLSVDCEKVVENMKKSGQKEFCLLVMPSHVRGLIDNMKRVGIDLERVTMVVMGQKEPWWHDDERVLLCEMNPAILAKEATGQIISFLDKGKELTGRTYKLHVKTENDKQMPLSFRWV